MLVYYNSQVQGPDGIVDAAGEAEEELEAIMPPIHPWKDIRQNEGLPFATLKLTTH